MVGIACGIRTKIHFACYKVSDIVVGLFTIVCIQWIYETKRYLQDPHEEAGQAKHTKKI